jgi:hypothetical protein
MDGPKKTFSGNVMNTFWPKITDESSARIAISHGKAAAIVVAVFTIILAVIVGGTAYLSIVDAIIFAVLAYFIGKESRVAAVVAFILFIVEKMMSDLTALPPAAWVVSVFIALYFFNGIRGTFAVARMKRKV